MEAWFIGGPWNNRLVDLPFGISGNREEIVMPLKTDSQNVTDAKAVLALMTEMEKEKDPLARYVRYYRATSLQTGIAVYTCLWELHRHGYATTFKLPSFRRLRK